MNTGTSKGAAAMPLAQRKTIFVVCPVFSCSPQREQNTAQVYDDGTVRVYDSISNTYTTCHSMSESQLELIRSAKPYSTVKI